MLFVDNEMFMNRLSAPESLSFQYRHSYSGPTQNIKAFQNKYFNRCQVCLVQTLWHKTILQCDWSYPGYKMVDQWLPVQYQISPSQLIIAPDAFTLVRYN